MSSVLKQVWSYFRHIIGSYDINYDAEFFVLNKVVIESSVVALEKVRHIFATAVAILNP